MTGKGWEIRIIPPERPGRDLRSRLSGQGGRRLVFVVLLAASLAGAGSVDAFTGRSGAAAGAAGAKGSAAGPSGSAVAAQGAQSSAWFCAGGIPSTSTAPVVLDLTNSGARRVGATLSAVSAAGATHESSLSVPARSQISVLPGRSGQGPWVAATVLLHGGGVGVTEVVDGPLGWSTAPCASSTSSRWYFAQGSTSASATLSLCLFNPLSTDAVVDVTLDSPSTGSIEPPAYQGIPVPAGSLVVENIGDHLLDNSSAGTEVTTSSGAVVAFELQSTPLSGGGGNSILLGAPSAARRWVFPTNVNPAGGAVVFDVLNPTGVQESVKIEVGLSQGQAEPISLNVAPHSVEDLYAEHETRIPTASAYELTFDTTRGDGIVVDRELAAPPGSASPQVGLVPGVVGGGTRMLVPGLSSPATSVEALAISDIGPRPARVNVDRLADGVALPGLDRRLVVRNHPLIVMPAAGSPVGSVPMIVTSSGKVAIEVDAAPAGSQGAAVLPTLPLPDAPRGR
jgi:hypothetical protein